MAERYRRDPNVVTRLIAGETLLVPIRQRLADLQRLYVLEDTARFIWEALDGRRTVEEIATELTEEFEVEYSRALQDVRRFCEELLAAGLIEPVG